MIKKVVTLSYLSAAAPPRINYGDCSDELPHDMFEEGGRVWLCALRVCDVLQVTVASFFVCLFCELRFIFLWLYDMELVLTCTCACGTRYYLNSKQDI